jgi:very-short-patch-repair endonuclease
MQFFYQLVPVAVILVFAVLFLAQKAKIWGRAPYQRGSFLTPNEKAFFRALKSAAGEGYHVCAQVRLADVVQIREGLNDHTRWKALTQVSSKSVDFLILSAVSLDPVLAIEVDDRSHFRPDRQARDVFVNQVFEEIGLPLLRVRAKFVYDIGQIKAALGNYGIPQYDDGGRVRIQSSR